MAAQQAQALGQFVVVCQGHAAFSGGDDFDRMKAEYRDVAKTTVADGFAFVFTANGVRRVFNDLEAKSARQVLYGLHIARLSGKMNRHHNFGQPTGLFCAYELVLQCLGAQVVGTRVNVHKIDLCAAIKTAVGRGHKGVGRGPQPVARPKV